MFSVPDYIGFATRNIGMYLIFFPLGLNVAVSFSFFPPKNISEILQKIKILIQGEGVLHFWHLCSKYPHAVVHYVIFRVKGSTLSYFIIFRGKHKIYKNEIFHSK